MTWFKKAERRAIRSRGGVAKTKTGHYDGKVRGQPVEIKAVKKDNRFRIGKTVHKSLVRNNGRYIFLNARGQSKSMSAKSVSKKIGGGKWFKDRTYPHKFLKREEVF